MIRRFIGSLEANHIQEMGRATVFLSSTFLDLEFERRFVKRQLEARGFRVIAMESHCSEDFNWLQWSRNQARCCDIFVRLYGTRAGTDAGTLGHYMSVSRIEEMHSLENALVRLFYVLNRPFSDASLLFDSPTEEEQYSNDVKMADYSGGWLELEVFRRGEPIMKVCELKRFLEADLSLSRTALIKHRLWLWRRTYFDTSRAGWYCAIEDERKVAFTERLFLWKRARARATFLVLLLLFALFSMLPLLKAFAALALISSAAAIVALSSAPTYAAVGEKTFMARGFFGLFTYQQLRSEKPVVKFHWGLMHDWFGVGAVSVHFHGGPKVFVPFVDTSREFWTALYAPAPVAPQKFKPLGVDKFKDLLRRFATEIEEEEKKG